MSENQKGSNKNPKITGAQMLSELDFPAYNHIPFIKCSYVYFSESFSKLVDYYALSASGFAKGEASFAIRFLFARCINDLVVGFHLATHGYVIQSHSVLRSIFESLNEIELFSTKNDYAKIWVNNPEEARKNLTPSKVRKLLKRSKNDVYSEMYSFFCEIGTHPSFKSTKTMSYVKKTKGEKPKLVVQIGPTDMVYPILFILVFCFLLLMSTSLSLSKHLKPNKETKSMLFTIFEQMESFLTSCVKPTFIKYEGKVPPEFEEILTLCNKQKEYISNLKNEN